MASLRRLQPAAGASNRRDFEGFFATYARELAAIVALATGEITSAEDSVQEAMTRAYADWERVSRMERADLWVLRVAQRFAIDSWRKRRRELPSEAASGASAAPPDIQRLWVRWGLENLGPEDRILIILRHRDGLSVDEIALALGRSPHTIAIYLKRARRRLRTLLKEPDP